MGDELVPTQRSPPAAAHKHRGTLIVYCFLCMLAMLGAITALVVVWFRKRKQRRCERKMEQKRELEVDEAREQKNSAETTSDGDRVESPRMLPLQDREHSSEYARPPDAVPRPSSSSRLRGHSSPLPQSELDDASSRSSSMVITPRPLSSPSPYTARVQFRDTDPDEEEGERFERSLSYNKRQVDRPLSAIKEFNCPPPETPVTRVRSRRSSR